MRFLIALVALLMATPAFAGGIEIQRASTLARPAELPSAGIFMVIANTGEADKLLSVKTDVAGEAMIHASELDDKGVFYMKHLDALDIPANTNTNLLPGGSHIMLFDMKGAFTAGDKISLTLTFEKAGEKKVDVDVIVPDEMSKRFPPEMMSDVSAKIEEANKKSGKPAEGAKKVTTLDKLRTKIQGLFEKEEAAPEAPGANLISAEEMERRNAMEPKPMNVSVPDPNEKPTPPVGQTTLPPVIETKDVPVPEDAVKALESITKTEEDAKVETKTEVKADAVKAETKADASAKATTAPVTTVPPAPKTIPAPAVMTPSVPKVVVPDPHAGHR